ncbi:MAG: hypothetical protein ABI266_07605 [Ginsengibacter sp.]
MKKSIFHLMGLLIFLLTISTLSFSQDSSVIDKKIPYRITVGLGYGHGYPLQERDNAAGGSLEFSIKNKSILYSIGARTISKLTYFEGFDKFDHSISSYDLTAGKIFSKGKLFSTISAGVGLVRGRFRGTFFSDGDSYYLSSKGDKYTYSTIGFPVSLKGIWVPENNYGVGIELYANFNSKNIFYGINLSQQFGRVNTGAANSKQ